MKKENNAKHVAKTAMPDNDFNIEEESSNWWKIIAVILVLILLVGGFAIFRNYENSKDNKDTEEKDDDKKDDGKKEDDDKKDDEKEEEDTNTNNGSSNNVVVVINNTNTKLTFNLPIISSTNEAGDDFNLSVPYVEENGKRIYAILSYEFRANVDDEFVAVSSLDSNLVGQYRITYTMVYSDGRVETKSQIVTFVDTKAPTVTGVSDGLLTSSDVTPVIWDASLYTATLNGQPYDGSLIAAVAGEIHSYELIVTDVNGLTTTINFTIDALMPTITVDYTPDGTAVTPNTVMVTITSDKPLYTVPETEWTLSDDRLTLTKEFVANGEEKLLLGDEAGNMVEVEVLVNCINTIVDTDPILDPVDVVTPNPEDPTKDVTVTIEKIVANKVKVIVTAIDPITIDADKVEGWNYVGLENGFHVYEKIYTDNFEGWIGYKITYVDNPDLIINGSFKVKVNILFDSSLVTYSEPDPVTGNVTVTISTTEDIDDAYVPAGWTRIDGNNFSKEYDSTTSEVIELIGTTTVFRAVVEVTITIPAPVLIPAPLVITQVPVVVEVPKEEPLLTEKPKEEETPIDNEPVEETIEEVTE